MKSARTAKAIKALASSLGRPPRPEEVVGNLDAPPTPTPQPSEDVSVQLNLRVPGTVKHRVRVLAARDRITHSELVIRALALYEESGGESNRKR